MYHITGSKGYTRAADYWALGCLIYELVHIRTPFQSEHASQIFQKIVASEKYLQFVYCPNPDFMDLIKSMLSPNPSYRLGNLNAGVLGIMEHPFFRDVDWRAIYHRTQAAPYVPKIKDASDTSNFGTYQEDKPVQAYTGSQECFNGF